MPRPVNAVASSRLRVVSSACLSALLPSVVTLQSAHEALLEVLHLEFIHTSQRQASPFAPAKA